MIYGQNLPDYSHDMYLKGFNAYQIFEANRRTNRKKREESIIEKETFDFIEALALATIEKAVDEMFEPFQ